MAEQTRALSRSQQQTNELTQASASLALILDRLKALASSLNEPLGKDAEGRLHRMAQDLSAFPLDEVIQAVMDWRMGEAPYFPPEQFRFFPNTAQIAICIRKARETVEDQAATEAFSVVLRVLRSHGLALKPVGGHIVRDRDDEGRPLLSPERSPVVRFPGWSEDVSAALTQMGWGDAQTGLALLAGHPGFSSATETGSWPLRTAEALEKRWRACWRSRFSHALTHVA